MSRNPSRLGSVQDVQGATVRALLDEDTISGLTFVQGQAYRVGQVGSFVRIPLGYIDLFGVVSQVGAGAVPEKLAADRPYGNRWLQIQLVGEGRVDGSFQRGISQYPTIDDPVHLVTETDLARIYGRPDSDELVRIGHLASAETIPALVDLNKLVTRHSAVLGSTGAGKSTTVAGLLAALSSGAKYPAARIILIDMHGEYSRALDSRATVFRVGADPWRGQEELYIPYWALTFDELLPITFGSFGAQQEAGRAAVQEKIVQLKRDGLALQSRDGVTEDSLTVDSPVPFSVHKLWYELHCEMRATHYEKKGVPQSRETWALAKDKDGKELIGDAMKGIPPRFLPIKDEKDDPEKIRLSRSQLNLGRELDQLGARIRDPRFDFLLRAGPWRPSLDGTVESDLDALLSSWLGNERPITILDLSGIPPAILGDLLGSLLRIMYDALFWGRNLPEGARERPLFIVLEEAHSYLASEKETPAARVVKRIVKEGRKYGIGIMLISQRPAEIDQTILSQCGTLFAMRLANPTDRSHVTGAAADHLEGLFAMLPVLRTGEAIVIGEAVQLPIRTLVDPPSKDRRPDSEDPRVVVPRYPDGTFDGAGGWNQAAVGNDYTKVVFHWRKQSADARRDTRKPGSKTKTEKGGGK